MATVMTTVMATAMGMVKVMGMETEMATAIAMATAIGNVQCCGRADALPPPSMDTKECAFPSAASWG